MNELTPTKQRGLILGGGGVTGLAWEVGVLHGLLSAGVPLLMADEVIGTSAGAFAGAALLDARGIAWAYDRQLMGAASEISADFPPEVINALTSILRDHVDDPEEAGRRLGAFAIDARTTDTAARMAVVRDRLATGEWPSDRLRMTAIDARTGRLHLLDRASGVKIDDAAAASGAAPGIWPVVQIGETLWIDGGSVSVTNAQLASAFSRCIVISPMTMNFSGASVQSQLDDFGATRSLLITPDPASSEAVGANPFDASRRPGAARAGYRQGLAVAEQAAAVWR
nr:patatin-like phospholipase family protein [Sphingomonas sp. Y57]